MNYSTTGLFVNVCKCIAKKWGCQGIFGVNLDISARLELKLLSAKSYLVHPSSF
jgi:hypothetical protein